MTPHRGGYCSLSFLQATLATQSWTFEGFFELTPAPLKGPSLLYRKLLPELQRCKNTVRRAALGMEVSDNSLETTDANLDCVSQSHCKILLFYNDCGKLTEWNSISAQTAA